MNKLIHAIEDNIADPTQGLDDEIFYFVGRLTPFVNVDLLIRHPEFGILLTWRADEHCGVGWHFPGGIIRFRESIHTRVKSVADLELSAELETMSDDPVRIVEMISLNKRERSHFISLLYECELTKESRQNLEKKSKIKKSKIKFFNQAPDDLLTAHKVYVDLF